MYSKEEVELWIARGRGDIPSPVDPGASANSARAMLDYNKSYGDIRGAFADKDKRFLLEDTGQFVTNKQLMQLENIEKMEFLENKIRTMKIIIIVFGFAFFALIANTVLNLF